MVKNLSNLTPTPCDWVYHYGHPSTVEQLKAMVRVERKKKFAGPFHLGRINLSIIDLITADSRFWNIFGHSHAQRFFAPFPSTQGAASNDKDSWLDLL